MYAIWPPSIGYTALSADLDGKAPFPLTIDNALELSYVGDVYSFSVVDARKVKVRGGRHVWQVGRGGGAVDGCTCP